MAFRKVNLVTQDKGDQWECQGCGKRTWHMSVGQPSACPKCGLPAIMDSLPAVEVVGTWLPAHAEQTCHRCNGPLVTCPMEGHVMSEYWKLVRGDGMVLKVCAQGCPVDESLTAMVRHRVRRRALEL